MFGTSKRSKWSAMKNISECLKREREIRARFAAQFISVSPRTNSKVLNWSHVSSSKKKKCMEAKNFTPSPTVSQVGHSDLSFLGMASRDNFSKKYRSGESDFCLHQPGFSSFPSWVDQSWRKTVPFKDTYPESCSKQKSVP